jgi:hypothetical protein
MMGGQVGVQPQPQMQQQQMQQPQQQGHPVGAYVPNRFMNPRPRGGRR